MDRQKIARELVSVARELTARRRDWADQIKYALGVAALRAPALQDYHSVIRWLEIAQERLKDTKRTIIKYTGRSGYDELVMLVKSYESIWEEIGKAEAAIDKAKTDISKLERKREGANKLLEY